VPSANAKAKPQLMEAYETLDCYGEVREVLQTLKKRGHRLAILSNGSPAMLESAVKSARLAELLDDVFSVHRLEKFKTVPETYALVTEKYGIAPNEVSFQSSNRWDIAGAAAFGFRCNWINRTGQPDEYTDLPPVAQLQDLRGLL
jgi:2-haloacid dehalogenase